MLRTIAILISALWCLCSAASDLQFRHYAIDDGMPSNCVRDIVQTDDGFMWFATDGGVVRFDGYRFKAYQLGKAVQDGSTAHDDKFALSLCLHNGMLIAGTDSYIYRYDAAAGAFVMLDFSCDGKAVNTVNARQLVSDGDYLWVVTMGSGVYRLRNLNGQCEGKAFHFPEYNDFVGAVFVDSRSDVWTISNQNKGGLMRLDRSADRFIPYRIQGYEPLAISMAEDDNHHLWLGTWDDGLICFDPFYGHILNTSDSRDLMHLKHIHKLLPMADGRIFIGSDAGLAIADLGLAHITVCTHDVLDANSLSDSFVYPIAVDREGGVWIGTYYGGVNYLPPLLKVFDRYQPTGMPNSLPGSIISDLVEDNKGNIWIASDDGGLCQYMPATGTFRHIELSAVLPNAVHAHHNLHDLCFDGDDLWIGSYTGGVFRYNTVSGQTRHYRPSVDNVNSLMDRSSYAIYLDSRNVVWVATGSWIHTYNRESDDFKRIKDLQALIIDIDEDRDGCLWVSTQGCGLWRYNMSNGEWHNYSYSARPSTLSHDHVNCVNIDPRGTLYAATAQGLSVYDRKNDCFTDVNLNFASNSISVLSVVSDDDDLWLTTETGLVKYTPSTGTCEVFIKSDGLSSGQFMTNSILRASNGRIYVGTRSGFTAFFPYQIKLNALPPLVAFTALDIPNDKHSASKHNLYDINGLDCIDLYPDDNTFSLSFASLSFTNPYKNQYAYRLVGFDNNWIMSGSDNKATYTNLPPGTYTFEVKASNGDNVWTDEAATIKIKVHAPWYWTLGMKVLYAILAAAALFLSVRAILRRKEHKHKVEINRISNDKEIELYQAKLSFFTMIAHEVRTPVSLIIGPLEKIMRSSERVTPAMSRDLNVIERNSQRLLFLVNQLLDFKKVEEAGLSLRFSPVQIRSLIMGIAERFRPSMEQKGIVLEVKYMADDGFTADIDAEGITKMVSNLLNNARKFAKSYVSLSVSVSKTIDEFTIVVSDDGVGISKENQSKIFKPFYQVSDDGNRNLGGTGLGLSIVQNVIEGHRGRIAVDSAIDCGTSFIVTLPIHQSVLTFDTSAADVTDEGGELDANANESVDLGQAKPVMLVVDDNEELCTFIANNFEDKYDVIKAHDGVEALDKLRSQEVSFIISDWMMPRLDGVELCREVRSDRNISHIPFVLLTAKTDNLSRVQGLNCGADAYVDKPFSLQVLEARVDNLLKMRELLRRKFSQVPLEPIETVASNPSDNKLLNQLTSVIEENFSNPSIDIDFLADKLDISRSGLYNKIKSLVDVSPNELIRITRLKHAAKLLADNKYRISEVCYMVGFNSTSYFSKCFQKQFGMTPSEFVAQVCK